MELRRCTNTLKERRLTLAQTQRLLTKIGDCAPQNEKLQTITQWLRSELPTLYNKYEAAELALVSGKKVDADAVIQDLLADLPIFNAADQDTLSSDRLLSSTLTDQDPESGEDDILYLMQEELESPDDVLPPAIRPPPEDPPPMFRRARQTPDIKGCVFCAKYPPSLDPMNTPLLDQFLEGNGRIIPRTASGLCTKHQRKMSKTIKRAISLGLLSYKKRVFLHIDPFQEPPPPPIYSGVLESDLPDEVVEMIHQHRAEMAEKKVTHHQAHQHVRH